MEDIRLAIGLMAFISIAVFSMTLRLLRFRDRIWLDIAAVVIVALLIVYVYTVWGQLWIVKYIPLPSVIILSNWFPPMLGALAAIVWLRFEPLHDSRANATVSTETEDTQSPFNFAALTRRLPILTVLLAGGLYSMLYFVPTEPPECGYDWAPPIPPMIFPVCKQTTPYTCSAASAATILTTLGDETSEQEMARLCLTKSGTTWLGLYHGLSWKLMGTKYQVEFFEGDTSLLQQFAVQHPVLLCCQLDPAVAELMPKYRQAGWIPGTAHSVVYFGMINDLHIVGDPAVGYEAWSTQDLNALWTGQGLRIAERAGSVNGRL